MTRILEILARLIAFPTVTNGPNLALIDWVEGFLRDAGFAVTRVPSRDGMKAGLLARIGEGPGGVLLSAHTDVVPVDGQDWTLDPFALTRRGERLHGRGTTDMKGFIACVLALAETLRAPARPVMIALSWDEEIGCKGIPEMIDRVIPVLGRPDLCVVGEPTLMRPAIGHKGKASYRATCTGEAGHSAMAPHYRNALHGAAALILSLRDEQARLLREGAQDPMQDPPCSTVHAGVMRGGVALNIVPDSAEVLFEIRHLASEPPGAILSRIALPEGVTVAETGSYPGLETDPATIAPLLSVLPDPTPCKIAYGTEAGFFAALGIPTVVCGPGTMADGHQPDESIAESELALCATVLRRLTAP
ncbi:acetylornithine deacetylase [Paenirhodobacter sp.]|uniref:acetylornithine deacetylase n=1 Tax=Paenirhodobacter sp. TaxID=1965326 RepID=UPI003B419AA4